MIETIRFWLCALCMAAGMLFEITAVIGVFRFSYALNRIHAASMGDTMGLFFVTAGLVIASGFTFLSLKLILLVVLMWFTSPVSSHMIGRLEYETYEDLSKEVTEWKR